MYSIGNDELLHNLAQNKFDPLIDDKSKLPDAAGLYFVCIKNDLTNIKILSEIEWTEFNNSKVLYIGIAGTKKSKRKSLRKRDYKDHFEGNNAGRSTLRKSLGVLFGYKQIPRDKDPSTGKTKFNLGDEQKLSKWMKGNLLLHFLNITDPWMYEGDLICEFNPPLNISKNYKRINQEFRRNLSKLRSNKR